MRNKPPRINTLPIKIANTATTMRQILPNHDNRCSGVNCGGNAQSIYNKDKNPDAPISKIRRMFILFTFALVCASNHTLTAIQSMKLK